VVDHGTIVGVDTTRIAAEVNALTGSWSPLTGDHPLER
jgi:hypothetical protein